ncbi:MATE family efflux transporter [Marinomonas algicola]|uniref:MATE family efflux transporter n=1 Tax=Marinomonas algicola TaxID=2773454 RepID=UPI001EFF27D6|nr:MATE family efflux transporter [Marinomonas algicola]
MSAFYSIVSRFQQDRAVHNRIWHMSWPPMLANITTPLLGLVDTMVVGHLGTATHMGAVAIGASVFSFIFWAFGFLRMGSTGLTAQALGKKDVTRVRELLFQSVLMGFSIGLLLILCRGPILELAMSLMSPSKEIEPWARVYFEARIMSAPAVLAGYALIGWFFGIQYSKGPLWVLLVINIANMILDYYAVYHLNMASDGVAWATVWSHYIGVILAIFLAAKKLRHMSGAVPVVALIKWRAYIELVQVNRYLFVRTVLLLIVMSFFTAQSAQQSDAILAANSVLLTFVLIISNALDGFAFSVEALCGEAKGANNPSQFRKTVMLACVWALLTAIGLTAIFWLFGNAIIGFLTSVPSVKSEAALYLPWLVWLPLLSVWSFMLDGVFIGVTAVKQMQNTMIFSVLLVFFPLWYISQPLDNHGLWMSFCCLFVARGLSLYWCYRQAISTEVWFEKSCS